MDEWDRSWLGDESPLCHICVISIFIGMVVLNLIPFSQTPILILLLFVILVGAIKWRMKTRCEFTYVMYGHAGQS